MTMIVPTGGDVGVDPCDALLVAPRGTTGSTLYLAQGQPVSINALPADLCEELDEAAGLGGESGTLWTDPVTATGWPSPVYIAGAAVKRVQASQTTGCMLTFANGSMTVTVPAITRDAMIELINATTGCGGGGSDGAGALGDVWSPVFGGGWVQAGPATYVRAPGVDGAADIVIATCRATKDAPIGSLGFTVGGLPAPLDNAQYIQQTTCNGYPAADMPNAQFIVIYDNPTQVTVGADGDFTGVEGIGVTLQLMYPVALV